MVASLRALLSGIIDYAGLFPPAQLPMEQAIRNYARYRGEAESWMLARFVCRAAQLPETEPFLEELFPAHGSFPCSALVGGGNDRTELYRNLVRDLSTISRFREHQGKRAILDVLEIRLPAVLTDLPSSTLRTMPEQTGTMVFCELATSSDWRQQLQPVIVVLQRELTAGLKIRCGGLEASAFPSCEQVAFVIAVCRDAKVPLKFTAGLHHPIRHFNAGLQMHMHGFINVFVAGALAHARGLSAEQLQPIIEDEDAAHFAFEDAGLRWADYYATTDEIIAARKYGVTSFGSCSFDEPRDDLRALGWLP